MIMQQVVYDVGTKGQQQDSTPPTQDQQNFVLTFFVANDPCSYITPNTRGTYITPLVLGTACVTCAMRTDERFAYVINGQTSSRARNWF